MLYIILHNCTMRTSPTTYNWLIFSIFSNQMHFISSYNKQRFCQEHSLMLFFFFDNSLQFNISRLDTTTILRCCRAVTLLAKISPLLHSLSFCFLCFFSSLLLLIALQILALMEYIDLCMIV